MADCFAAPVNRAGGAAREACCILRDDFQFARRIEFAQQCFNHAADFVIVRPAPPFSTGDARNAGSQVITPQYAMRTLLAKYGTTFEPGDVYLVNDPFDGASHTPDLFVVKPSFAGGRLVGGRRIAGCRRAQRPSSRPQPMARMSLDIRLSC